MSNNNEMICADCGGFDVEWMYPCYDHKGVFYCRGCECPYCEEDIDEIFFDDDGEIIDYE